MSKIKNIIIFAVIIIFIILIYIFFIKKAPEEANLVTSIVPEDVSSENAEVLNQNSLISKDFLSILLNVKNIKLNDQIFSDKAFISLHDSSITLVSPGDEGRPNPFAPIGSDIITPSSILPKDGSLGQDSATINQNLAPTLDTETQSSVKETIIPSNTKSTTPPANTKAPSTTTDSKTQKKETKIPN